MTGVPKPLATSAVQVAHDPVTRALMVRPAPGAGWAGSLWRKGHAAWTAAVKSGRYSEAPSVYASGAGREGPRGEPVRDGWLRFTIRDERAYQELTSAPDLRAIVTVDRETAQILGVRFRSEKG